MKRYRIEVRVIGTAYIDADSPWKAMGKARAVIGDGLRIHIIETREVPPAISLAPEMTIERPVGVAEEVCDD